MLRKPVYVNDQPIGEARSWKEVGVLLESKGIEFPDNPGTAEGPSGFWINGSLIQRDASR